MNPSAEHDLAVWRQSVDAHSAFLTASRAFFSDEVDRVALIREALRERKGQIRRVPLSTFKHSSTF